MNMNQLKQTFPNYEITLSSWIIAYTECPITKNLELYAVNFLSTLYFYSHFYVYAGAIYITCCIYLDLFIYCNLMHFFVFLFCYFFSTKFINFNNYLILHWFFQK